MHPAPPIATRLRRAAILAAAALAACGASGGEGDLATVSAPALPVSSPTLAGGAFPRTATCDGGDQPPAVGWGPLDPATRSIVVELTDPDAPGGTFTHWVLVAEGIPVSARSLADLGDAARAGRNDFGSSGYRGPCPPRGDPPHHYHLTVVALDGPLGDRLGAGFRRGDVEAARQAAGVRVVQRGELVATYAR